MKAIMRRIDAAETTIQAYTSTRNHKRQRAAVAKLSMVCTLWREKSARELGTCVVSLSSDQCCDELCCHVCPLDLKFNDLQAHILSGLGAAYCPEAIEHNEAMDSMNLRQLLRIDNNVWCMDYEEETAIAIPSGAYERRHLDGPRRMHMWGQPCALTDAELDEQIQKLQLRIIDHDTTQL